MKPKGEMISWIIDKIEEPIEKIKEKVENNKSFTQPEIEDLVVRYSEVVDLLRQYGGLAKQCFICKELNEPISHECKSCGAIFICEWCWELSGHKASRCGHATDIQVEKLAPAEEYEVQTKRERKKARRRARKKKRKKFSFDDEE